MISSILLAVTQLPTFVEGFHDGYSDARGDAASD